MSFPYTLLVGGYTKGGLRIVRFDPEGAKLVVQETPIPGGVNNPSWIATAPGDSSSVFVVNEVEDGRLLAVKLSGLNADGDITGQIVSDVSSGGACPAHLKVLKDEVVVGNYMGSTVLSLPWIQSPFGITEAPPGAPNTSLLAFDGTGPNPDRQERSHPHEVYQHHDELLVPDLGVDRTWRLKKNSEGHWEVKGKVSYPSGSGPRHIKIHDGVLYTVLELTNELSLHKWTVNPEEEPELLAVASTFASGVCPDPTMLTAEIVIHGSFIYVSNRNDPSPQGDSLAVFSLPTTPATAEGFKLVNEIRTGMKHLRSMNFSKDVKYLAVAGVKSNTLKIYESIEGSKDGGLKEVATVTGLEEPTAVIWL